MSFGFLGCNPEQTWANRHDAPEVGTTGGVGEAEYVVVRADGAIDAGEACIIHKTGEAQPVTTTIADDSYPLCIPQVDIGDNEYGWGLVKGAGQLQVGASCAANTSLATTATAGQLDDADTAGRVGGLQLTSARSSSAGLAPCWAYHPRLDILA